ncbi:MAG TPA: Nre family DNA repair protein [Candidatus Nanoarchaeia archaeon]|nr:Nre family DNA repair protein [Candidatus Nanoarchaeia archaeon]
MYKGKASYLNKLYSRMSYKSVEYSEKVEGSSPPSVFIGRYGYPNVAVGPLLAEERGDTAILDLPEEWLRSNKDAQDIIDFRMRLIRGKQSVNVKDTPAEKKVISVLREIALAKNSLEVNAEFKKKPRGLFFHEEMQPFGPSASLKEFSIGNSKFDQKLEKAHYDTDLKAKDAVIQLYEKDVLFSSIQKAFSTGAFGLEKNRKLVPTRWSITAVDSTLSQHLLDELKHYEPIGEYRVYESTSLNNRFIVLLMPTMWRYEWIEAFFPSIVSEKLEIFGDHERFERKAGYSPVGGCYYSARLAVAELLKAEKKQAGVIILREAYPGYIPLGVWNVRENMRMAMQLGCQRFETFSTALGYAASRLKLSTGTWLQHSTLLKEEFVQKRLGGFVELTLG